MYKQAVDKSSIHTKYRVTPSFTSDSEAPFLPRFNPPPPPFSPRVGPHPRIIKGVANRRRLLSRLRSRWRQRRRRRASGDPKPVAIAQGTPSGTLDAPTLPAWEQASEGKVGGSNARPSGVGFNQEDVGEGTTDLGVTAITIDGVDVVVDPTCQDSGRTHRRGSEVALPSTGRARPEMYDGEEISPETWEKVMTRSARPTSAPPFCRPTAVIVSNRVY